jgi:hypothetical protein
MRKFTVLLVVTTLFATGIYYKSHDLFAATNIKTEQVQLGDFTKEQNKIAELKKMQDPTIVRSELKRVGKLICLEGRYKYKSHIDTKDKFFNKFTLREITLDFEYGFQIGCDLQYIKVSQIDNKIVHISIPKKRIQLQSITMNIQNSKIIDGEKMFLVDQFSPSEVQVLENQSTQNTVNKIGADKELFNTAYINLQKEIEKLVLGLGYQQVVFTEDMM